MLEIRKQTLIDKCEYSGILIEHIDENAIKELVEQKKAKITVSNDDGSNKYKYKVTIKENGYCFKGGYNKLVGGYGILQTSIPDDDIKNLNCYNVEQYKKHIETIKKDMENKYKIYLNTENPIIRKIEINKTFKIDGEMPTYERVLNLIMALLPAKTRLKTQVVYADKDKNLIDKNTYYATSKHNKTSENNSKSSFMIVKFYNKTEQLKSCYKIIVEENYIRLEFTIVGKEKIKGVIGTKYLNMLTDEMIDNYFNQKVADWIVKPIEKWKQEQKKKALKIMKECKFVDGYKWINKCLTRFLNEEIKPRSGNIPLILDIEEIIPLVNELYPNGDRRKRAKSVFRKAAKEDVWNLTNRDDLKLQELIDKLTSKEDTKKSNDIKEKSHH